MFFFLYFFSEKSPKKYKKANGDLQNKEYIKIFAQEYDVKITHVFIAYPEQKSLIKRR